MASSTFNRVTLSDVASGNEVGRIEAGDDNEGKLCATFTPDGKTLIVHRGGGKVHLWDVSSGKTRSTIDVGKFGAKSMALTAEGKTLAVGQRDTLVVRFWNVQTGKELFAEFVGHDAAVARLTFSPDGKTLASG